MINLYKQDGETLYGIKEFLLDSKDDILELPTNIRVGSSALIIDSGEIYILNGLKKWVPFAANNGNSDGTNNFDIMAQLDQDGDGIIDQAESTSSIEMMSF